MWKAHTNAMQIKRANLNYSLLSSWSKCNRRAYLSTIRNLRHKPGEGQEDRTAINIGICVHAALEAHYTGEDIAKAVDETHAKLGLPKEGKGCIEHIDDMVSNYLQKVDMPGYKTFIAEEVLEMPLEGRLYVRGTPDLVLEKDGVLYPVDFKTKSNTYRYLTQSMIDISWQFTTYRNLIKYNYPDYKVSDTFMVHGIQTQVGRPYISKLTTKRDEHKDAQWKSLFIYLGNQIINALEKNEIHPTGMGEQCHSYNRECEFYKICNTPSRALEEMIKQYYEEGPEYKGFTIEWDK